MFNRYIDSRTIYPEKIEHHEHRAPTDESIRIYDEMRDKARESVVCAHAGDIGLDMVRVFTKADDFSQNHVLHVRFRLNGEVFGTDVPVDDRAMLTNPESTLKLAVDHLSKSIAAWVMGEFADRDGR